MTSNDHNTETFTAAATGNVPREHELERCADDLAKKYRAGRLPELQETALTAAWKYLVRDLRTCCPGFSEIEYGIALNHAFIHR